jgi:hypothetical protein
LYDGRSNTLNDKVKNAIRTVLYRESGKTTVSNMLATLRNMGYTHLGNADEFSAQCKENGYRIEYQYKKSDPNGKPSRTFILLPVMEAA